MADFISDEEMAKMGTTPDFISDEEMAMAEQQAPLGGFQEVPLAAPPMSAEEVRKSFINKDLETFAGAGEAVGNVFEFIDRYTGAPIRKFITESATGKELEQAPTGKEQAAMLGIPTQEYKITGLPDWLSASPAGVAGVGLEVAQDPFLLLGGAAKIGTKAMGKMFPESATRAAMGEQAGEAAAKATAEASAEAAARGSTQMGQEAIQAGTAESNILNKIGLSGGDLNIKTQGELFSIKPPQSLEELEKWKPPEGISTTMQSQLRLGEIEKTIPDLQIKPLKYHYDMLDDPKSMKALKVNFENLSSPQKSQIAKYNLGMLNEAEAKTAQTIDTIAKGSVKGLPEQGNAIINAVKEKYTNTKSALKPYFDEMKKTGPISKNEADDIKLALAENTKINKLVEYGKNGEINLKPNNTKTGLSDQEYNSLKRVFDDLDGPVTFEEIQRQRDFLRKQIDRTNPSATEELQKVRSILLDKLEDVADKQVPEMRKVFKDYAINERSVDDIERIIGGKIESLDAIYAANPDKVVTKVLSNPNYSIIVKNYVGEPLFNEMVGSYLNSGLSKSIDKVRGFQPHKMRAFLAQNKNVLARVLPPKEITRLEALADHGYLARRFLDEVNPSGTAEAFLSALKPGSFTQEVIQKGPTAAIEQEIYSKVLNRQKQKQAAQMMNEVLSKGMAGATATADTSLKQTLYQNLAKKMKNIPQDLSLENIIKTQGATATGRGMLRSEKEGAQGEKSSEKKPNQSSIMEKLKGSEYEALLQNALKNGGERSFAAANYVLMNRDKRYRDLINQVEEG